MEVRVDGAIVYVAALGRAGAVGVSLVVEGAGAHLGANTDEPRWWPRIPLRVGSRVAVRIVVVEAGTPPRRQAPAGGPEAAAGPPLGLRVTVGAQALDVAERDGAILMHVGLERRAGRAELDLTSYDPVAEHFRRWLRAPLRPGEFVTAEVTEMAPTDG